MGWSSSVRPFHTGTPAVLGQVGDELLREAAVLDAVVHAPQDLGGVLDRFLLAHLAVGQEGGVAALVPAGRLEGAAGAGAGLVEDEDDVLAVEEVAADAGALLGLEVGGQVEHIADLFGAEILEGKETSSFEVDGH